MSDTPRTDAIIHEKFRNHVGWRRHPITEHARELERENARLKKQLEEADAYFNNPENFNP